MPAEGALRGGTGPRFGLIETMRWDPAEGFVRADLHLSRLTRSAAALQFPFDRNRVEGQLLRNGGTDQPLRVRLTLSADGAVAISTEPFVPPSPDTVWTLALARTRLDRNDPLLAHKTTRREIFDKARAEQPRSLVDELVLLNQDGQLCEGTITNIFLADRRGILVTPALHCGLLPGVLREQLVAQGRARESELDAQAIANSNEIYVGNSLRGLVRARLVCR